MKHFAIDQLQTVAGIERETPPLSRNRRIERWAELLESIPDQRLATLQQTENLPPEARERIRVDGSPISVAFADPVLRAAGLQGDSYGEAKRFFQLTDYQLHRALCYCHFGGTVSAATAAHYVRKASSNTHRNLIAWLWDTIAE
ncbi:hypothetical protein N8E89_24270 (plasmid) [Phyllobacterium sp. A18/5-2]|uniref:hypothetical protein n=1 Tax=Phyllobacterium sp. A18/5-2 TaxID=2978392 RepID=UPI0021C9D057|nr:hypothetical protein [Phyllobacterium sp. A18/5-2]UXN66290.1 hypothetical protein N8E89_24270 [Phyllobacterium sp. A18/5-2]